VAIDPRLEKKSNSLRSFVSGIALILAGGLLQLLVLDIRYALWIHAFILIPWLWQALRRHLNFRWLGQLLPPDDTGAVSLGAKVTRTRSVQLISPLSMTMIYGAGVAAGTALHVFVFEGQLLEKFGV
jgi:hypothetical protein